MADNVVLNSGSGGATLAADDISGIHHQRVKVEWGPDGTVNETDDASGKRLPVKVAEALPTGTNNIGDVDVASLPSDVAVAEDGALGLGVLLQGDDGTDRKNINVDATTGDVQVDVTNTVTVDLGANNDVTVTSGTITANLGAIDNAVLDSIDAAVNGTLTVGSHAVTNAGVFATQEDGAALTALQLIDDVVATDDTTTHATGATKGVTIMAAATPTDSAVAANDIGSLAMSLDRRLHVDADVTASVALDVSAATVTVDATGQGDVPITLAGEAVVLGAGSASIGTLGANTGVDIGDVDVLSVTPGTAAGNLGKAVDSAAGGTDTGVATLAVRDDALSALTPIEGDYVPLRVNSTGALHVTGGGGGVEYTEDDVAPANPTGSAPILVREDGPTLQAADGDFVAQRSTGYGAAYVQIVDSSGNFINSFGGSGGTSHADDAAFTIGSAASLTPAGYLADDTTPDSVDEGDVGVPRMTLSRKPYAVIADATSENNAAVDGSGHLQVDIAASSVALDVSAATVTVDLGANNDVTIDGSAVVRTEDAAHNTGDTGIMGLAVRRDADTSLVGTDGDYAPLQVNAAGALKVEVFDGGDSHTIDGTVTANAGTNLNTSALALETGGNLATLAGAVAGGQMQADIVAALPAGDNNIGNVDIASAVPAGANLVGDVGLSGARTSGGSTPYRNIDVDETEDEVKGTAGQIYWIHCMNLTAAVVYLQIYDATAASVTVGTTTPTHTFPIATQGDTNGAGFTLSIPNGVAFGTAITVACTTTIGGTGGPAANGCVLNMGYG